MSRRRTPALLLLACLLGACGGGEPSGSAAPSGREAVLRAKADSGDAQALLELGWAYDFGDQDPSPAEAAKPYIIPGIHQDRAESKRLIEQAAIKGSVRAMAIMGMNDLFRNDFTGTVYWSWMAAKADPKNKPQFDSLVTIAQSDPAHAYSFEQRHAIFQALQMDPKTIEAAVLGGGAADATAADPVIERAKKNSYEYLCKMCANGSPNFFNVLSSEGVYNDHERDNTSYPITVFMEVRFQGPYGMLKRDASFACDAQGSVIQPLTLPEQGP